MPEPQLTERQRKWFASVREGLARDTGRSLAEWAAIARTCPHQGHRARLAWFKQTHGLLQNRASLVLAEAFGRSASWGDDQALIAALWPDAEGRAIFGAVDARAMALEGAIRTPRKGFTAWARGVQFAALRPVRGGALLGLAVAPNEDSRLEPRGADGWSERLVSRVRLDGVAAVDETLAGLLRRAWEGA